MKINATLPFDRTESPEEFLRPEAVTEIGIRSNLFRTDCTQDCE